jgi:hypothetical protein
VFDQFLGHALQLGEKILPGNSQALIHKGIQVVVPSKGKVPFENHSIKARQNRYNGTTKLRHKRRRVFHGVLLQGMSLTKTSI